MVKVVRVKLVEKRPFFPDCNYNDLTASIVKLAIENRDVNNKKGSDKSKK